MSRWADRLRDDRPWRAAAVAAAAALRWPHLAGPYRAGLDAGFQEALALSHLELGLAVTRGLPTVGWLDGHPIHHTTHPPLLHLLYASAFAGLGVHEWVARGLSMLAFAASVWLIGQLARTLMDRALPAVIASWTLALMPLATRYGQSAAFGTPAVAFLLAGWWATELARREPGWPNRIAMAGWWSLALLTEWTAYLVFPLLLLQWVIRDRRGWGWPLYFVAHPALVLAAYQGWAWKQTGTVELLHHAAIRADPAFLTRSDYWFPIGRILLAGAPVAVATLAAAGLFLRRRRREAGAPSETWVALLPSAYPLLYLLTAPQLIGQHPFEMYNFAPLLALGFAGALGRLPLAAGMIAASLMLFDGVRAGLAPPGEEGAFFHDLALALDAEATPGQTIYSTAAVGHFRFYTPLRVWYGLGAGMPPMQPFLAAHQPEWVWVDLANPDVASSSAVMEAEAGEGRYARHFTFAHGILYRRVLPGEVPPLRLANRLEEARSERPPDAASWTKAEAVLARFPDGSDRRVYAIAQHPTRSGTVNRLVWEGVRIPDGGSLVFGVGLEGSAFARPGADGVNFRVELEGQTIYEGALTPRRSGAEPVWPMAMVDLWAYQGRTVRLALETRALANDLHDRAYWIDPRLISMGLSVPDGR